MQAKDAVFYVDTLLKLSAALANQTSAKLVNIMQAFESREEKLDR